MRRLTHVLARRTLLWAGVATTLLVASLCAALLVHRAGAPEFRSTGARQDALRSLGYIQWSVIRGDDRGKSGVLSADSRRYQDGVNLYHSRHRTEAYLMDMRGTILHTWTRGQGDEGGGWHHVEIGDDGNLFAIAKDASLVKIDRDSRTIWESRHRFHHDLAVADSGEIYALCREVLWVRTESGAFPILDDQIVVLSPDGTLLRKISMYGVLKGEIERDVLDRARTSYDASLARQETPVIGEDTAYDVFHTNTVEIFQRDVPGLARQGDILVCVRNLNAIAVVNPADERIVWIWGQNHLDAPHQPSLTRNGTILAFDNGRKRGYSRIVELDPVSEQVVWEYRGDPPASFYSELRGGAQKLPNGNILITESDSGHVFEITEDKTTVWDFWNPETRGGERAIIYRMTRIDRQHLNSTQE